MRVKDLKIKIFRTKAELALISLLILLLPGFMFLENGSGESPQVARGFSFGESKI